MAKSPPDKFTIPGLSTEDANAVHVLQDRLNALIDLALTLKHIHWNVVGPHFIAVHEMLDPQVDAVREMVDDTAERIATLGGAPDGHARARWSGTAPGTTTRSAGPTRIAHLGALDLVYDRGHRRPPQGDRRDRRAGPGHPGHAHRPDRRARAVPVVRAGPPRELRRRAVDAGAATEEQAAEQATSRNDLESRPDELRATGYRTGKLRCHPLVT